MKRRNLNTVDKKVRTQSKFRWIMKGSWAKLTRGEKVARVAVKTMKFGLTAAIVIAIGSVVIGLVLGILVAMGIAGAITGGFQNASRTNTGRLYGHYKW